MCDTEAEVKAEPGVDEPESGDIPLPDDAADKVLSFQEAMAIADKKIHALISNDPLLNNLHPEVTTDELKSYLALEHGQAMSLVVHKADNDYYTVVVEQKATVLDLKKALRRHVTLRMARKGVKRVLSWKYVWRTYWLSFEGELLKDDNALLRDFSIRNNSQLSFVKRLRER
uniref:Putative cytochrome c oxidase subunit cox19 n=1 Tax=Amblyomma aureolatum TaxID=187763 RepID=A0A1E1WYM7_9ACAR